MAVGMTILIRSVSVSPMGNVCNVYTVLEKPMALVPTCVFHGVTQIASNWTLKLLVQGVP